MAQRLTDLPHRPQQILRARLCEPPPFQVAGCSSSNLRGARGARRKGLLYERAALDHFEGTFGSAFIASPWLSYFDGQDRFCQPDGLLIQPSRGVVTCFEYKYQHTIRAWFQLVELYEPVLRHIFPPKLWKIALCEVVKWYDKNIEFPTTVKLQKTLTDCNPEHFSIHIWTPKPQSSR